MDDWLKQLTDSLVGMGIKGYGAIADRSQMPSNRRVYLDTFADENTAPITEQSFTSAELKSIGDLIRAKQLANPTANTGYIQYKDYGNFIPKEQLSVNAGIGATNPYENIRTTLGQFNYVVDPKTGTVSVKDTYDFNPTKGKAYQAQAYGDYVGKALDPLTILRMYGESKMSSASGKGRPVQIQMPGLLGR